VTCGGDKKSGSAPCRFVVVLRPAFPHDIERAPAAMQPGAASLPSRAVPQGRPHSWKCCSGKAVHRKRKTGSSRDATPLQCLASNQGVAVVVIWATQMAMAATLGRWGVHQAQMVDTGVGSTAPRALRRWAQGLGKGGLYSGLMQRVEGRHAGAKRGPGVCLSLALGQAPAALSCRRSAVAWNILRYCWHEGNNTTSREKKSAACSSE
jgi:hypothetical protein